MFDLLSMAELTLSAGLVIAAFAAAFGFTAAERSAIAIGMTLWLAAILWLGASGALHYERGLGVPGLGVTVVLPILIITGFLLGTRSGRARVAAATLPILVAVQAVRVLGISFVLLHAAGRLPAPFAPVAGWGDIAVGVLALPVALALSRSLVWATKAAKAWTLFGILDLLAAIGLGIASSPGPVRIFLDEPGSALMTTLPWIVIPCFLVPALFSLHLVTLAKLRDAAGESRTALAGA